MRIQTAFIFGLVVSAGAAAPFAPGWAASAACSGAALTELRMTECLAPATRGIRPASPAGATQPGATQPGATQAGVSQPSASAGGVGKPGAVQSSAGLAASPPPVAAQSQPGLDLEIKFPFGSAELTSDAKVLLQRLAHVLSAGELASRSIKVVGHTDAAGSDELNQTLSLARAQAVSAYLAEQGVAGRRLVASGVGKSEHKNAQDPLSAENRRVEIVPAG